MNIMPRIFLGSIVITAVMYSASPEVVADSDFNLAIKGGPNAAILDHDNRVNRYGFSGGLAGYFQWPAGKHLFLGGQSELLYTPRGAEVVLDGATQGGLREHYLDFTVAIRPGVQLGPMTIYLLLGGSLNLLMSANNDNAMGATQDITNDLHRIDVALLGGVGAGVRLPQSKLGPFQLGTVFLEARHDIGLLDIDLNNGGFKNRTSSLMLGLSFVLGDSPAADPSPATQTADRLKGR